MNPEPLTALDGDMFRELMAETRHIRDQISSVDTKLDLHISDETHDFNAVRDDIAEIRDAVTMLKTKLGMIAGVAGLLAAGAMQLTASVFF